MTFINRNATGATTSPCVPVVVIVFLMLTGCVHSTVKKEQSASTRSSDNKIDAAQPTGQPEQKEPEALGVIGGSSADKKVEQNISPKKQESINYRGNDDQIKQFYAEYETSVDKLGFLLAHVDAPQDKILAQVASLLGRFDDPKSIAALKLLEQHGAREDSGVSVAQKAQESLQWLAAAPDLGKIQPSTSAADLEKLIIKYRDNDVAHKYIYTAMKQTYENDPAKYIPLFIEYYASAYYASAFQTIELAKKYPDITDKGLDKCLDGTNASNVGSCMVLVGKLGNSKYLDKISDIAFFNKGNIDYKKPQVAYNVRDQALTAYSYIGAKSLPYLEKILYSQNEDENPGVISTIAARYETYGANESLGILLKYQKYCESQQICSQKIIDSLNRAIKIIEAGNTRRR